MTSQLPKLECACATLRRATRALTQAYEAEMREYSLSSTQFTILKLLSQTGELTQGQLGQALAMDSTTLTRTLRTMAKSAWIAQRPGKDRRERWVRLAPAGKAKFNGAHSSWAKAQSRFKEKIGNHNWQQLETLLNQIVEVTTE